VYANRGNVRAAGCADAAPSHPGDAPPPLPAQVTYAITPRCPPGSTNDLEGFPAAVRLVPCYRLMQLAEAAAGTRYDFVLRTRTDALFLRPFPRADAALARWSAGRDLLLFDDQLAVGARRHAATLLLNPTLAFRACADAEQWTRACGRHVSAAEVSARGAAGPDANERSGGQPCSPSAPPCPAHPPSHTPTPHAHPARRRCGSGTTGCSLRR